MLDNGAHIPDQSMGRSTTVRPSSALHFPERCTTQQPCRDVRPWSEASSALQRASSYPQLVVDDIRAALEYAAATVRERQLPLRIGA